MIIDFKETDNRQDYISIDKKTVISSEGIILKIGDKVKHDSAGNEIATIKKFTINKESYDIIAHTTKGTARISFLYNLK